MASRLARVPDVVAGSITSYAGGAMGHDPMRVGTAARARGLTPNVHVTCVGQDRDGIRKTLDDLQALGIENVFALTGDWPRPRPGSPPPEPPVFDIDSVQLVGLIAGLRRTGRPLHVAVAVSPFKYVEADCAWQYLKLEKKIAAGADCAITQVGWDAEKFRELKRYLAERGLRTPLLGNVYVLGPRAAERMARGEPPGCWVSPALLETVRQEARGKDGGLRARLERAARTVAVLRGLGYAGAYLGGTHDADHVAWIIRRARELGPRWEELAGELRYGLDGGFYLYGQAGGPDGRRAPCRRRAPGARPRVDPPGGPDGRGGALAAVDRARPRRPGTALPGHPRHAAPAGAGRTGRLGRPAPSRRPRGRACSSSRSSGRSSAVRRAATACSGTSNTCVRRRAPSTSGTARAAARISASARSSTSHASGSVSTPEPGPPDASRTSSPRSRRPGRTLRGTSSWINYLLDRDSRPRP